MFRKPYLSLFCFLFITIGISMVGYSQPPGDPASGGDPDPTVPITGIEILIGVGGLLGARKAYNNRKKNKSL